jgi:hypothetical protein
MFFKIKKNVIKSKKLAFSLASLFLVSVIFLVANQWSKSQHIEKRQEWILKGDEIEKQRFLNIISQSHSNFIVGAYKLHQGLLPDDEILKALNSAT